MPDTKQPKNTAHRPRSKQRFERDAKALRKNLEKRKKQQAEREKLKNNSNKD